MNRLACQLLWTVRAAHAVPPWFFRECGLPARLPPVDLLCLPVFCQRGNVICWRSGRQIETIKVHDLGPCVDKVLYERHLRVFTAVGLRQGAKLGV